MKGSVNGMDRYWNRLGDGQEVDLTSCQFGGDGFTPLAIGCEVETPDLVDPRYLHFAALVLERLTDNGRAA